MGTGASSQICTASEADLTAVIAALPADAKAKVAAALRGEAAAAKPSIQAAGEKPQPQHPDEAASAAVLHAQFEKFGVTEDGLVEKIMEGARPLRAMRWSAKECAPELVLSASDSSASNSKTSWSAVIGDEYLNTGVYDVELFCDNLDNLSCFFGVAGPGY